MRGWTQTTKEVLKFWWRFGFGFIFLLFGETYRKDGTRPKEHCYICCISQMAALLSVEV